MNKLLARRHTSDCNPTKSPCFRKLHEVLTPLQNASPLPTPQRNPKP